jgi:hypothetical protein
VDVGTVSRRDASEPFEDGARRYEVETRDPDRLNQRIVHPDHRWVRQCYDVATEGERAPYYCSTDRTVTGTWIGGVTAAVSLGVTWLVAMFVTLRVPPPIAARPASAGVWVFERAETERRAHWPVRRTLSRLADRHYALRAGILALTLAFGATLVAGTVGPYWVEEWTGASGALHIAVFLVAYFAWILRGTLEDQAYQARLAIGIGAGVGLFAASFFLVPPGG